MVIFEVLNYIRESVTSIQLIDTDGNVNHAVSVARFVVYDYTYKKELPLVN